MRESFVITLHCPAPDCQSRGGQRCTFDRSKLKTLLDAGEDITTVGPDCHHTWVLLKPIVDKLRTALLKQR